MALMTRIIIASLMVLVILLQTTPASAQTSNSTSTGSMAVSPASHTVTLLPKAEAKTIIVAAVSQSASFSILPLTTSVRQNQIFTMAINVAASSQPVDGAQAYLNFDPNYLRVVDANGNETNQIVNGELYNTTWPDVLTNTVNNATGQINYAAGKGTTGSAANTLFTLAIVRFKAIAQISAPGTAITFDTSIPRSTKAVYGLDTVTGSLTGGTVAIVSPGSVNFSLDPSATNVQQNGIFTINIKVNASSQPVDGAQAYLNFDPNYLRVVDASGNETNQIVNGELYNTTWPDVLTNTANNSTGQINYAAGKGTSGSSANTLFTLATIRFKAITQTGVTPTAVAFNTAIPRATKAVYGLDTVTGSLTGGTVAIARSPFSLDPSATNVQQDGIFTINIKVNASSQPVDGAQAYLNFDPNYLRVVDASGNETNQVVNGELYNTTWPDVLTNTVNNATGQINYAAGKGTSGSSANTLFTLATIRFKATTQTGATPTAVAFNTAIPRATKAVYGLNTVTGTLTDGTVTIARGLFSLDPPATNVQQNGIFTINIKVNASSQPVDGAQAYLNFNPDYLRVVDANGNETNQIVNGELYNTTWPDVLTNTVNNATGQINYAAGKGTSGSSANTLFTLATVRFKAIAQISAPGTAITFGTSIPRSTRAVYGLNTVTGTLTGGTVIIGASDVTVIISAPDVNVSQGGRSLPDPSTFAMVGSGLAGALLYIGISRLRRRPNRSR